MKKTALIVFSTTIVLSTLIFSCSKSDGENNTPPPSPPAGCNGTPGPLFIAVKNLMQANCQSCHNSSNSNGGKDWTVDCNIVSNKDRIKVRAVDQGTMPPTGPLPQSEKDKILAWINAGGRITD